MSRPVRFSRGLSMVVHPDGTGSLFRFTDGRRVRRLPETVTRMVFGNAVIESIKGTPTIRRGTLTVTGVDHSRGIITMSAAKPLKAPEKKRGGRR